VVERLGWKSAQGALELFPSHTRYRAGNDPKTFSLCQGLRLPGQEGSALWTGSRWAEEPELQWQELAAALVMAEPSAAFAAASEGSPGPARSVSQAGALSESSRHSAAGWHHPPQGSLDRSEPIQRSSGSLGECCVSGRSPRQR